MWETKLCIKFSAKMISEDVQFSYKHKVCVHA